MVNFRTRMPDCDSVSLALSDLFISSDASVCSTMTFPPLGNSDHVIVSVSIDFPKRDAPFHCIASDHSCADCDSLHDHLRDVPWEDIFKLLLVNFVSGFRLELMYVYLMVSIKSNPTHLHGFQLLVLLP